MYLLILAFGIFLTVSFSEIRRNRGSDIAGILTANFIITFVCFIIVVGLIRLIYLDFDMAHTKEYKDLKISSYDINTIEVAGIEVKFDTNETFIVGRTPENYILNGHFEEGEKKVKLDIFSTFIEKNDSVVLVEKYWVRDVRKEFNNKIFFKIRRKEGEWKINTEDDRKLFIPEDSIFKDI